MRQPVRCRRTGMWLARYRMPDGRVRQAGRFARKSDAQQAIIDALATREAGIVAARSVTVVEFLARWPEAFPRHPRTTSTNVDRITRYVLPHLPGRGRLPLSELRRPMLREAQAALLRKGLAKETIDGAFSSLSAMLTDAVDDELLDANPGRGLRVKPNDPRLKPARPPRRRRGVPPEEVGAFIAAVEPRWRAVCWAPFLTGVRPGELFAMRREEIDREAGLIYVHETVDRYGRLQPGLKSTHHIAERELRGRWTLVPASLLALVDAVPPSAEGLLFATRRGKLWSHRNFYRDVWSSAQERSGTSFTLYDARHTFSSRLLSAGIPLVEVAAWMGHSLRAGGAEVNTTSRTYAHATGEHRAAALEALELFVGRAANGGAFT
ncbi:MAG: tyrosine-type recombinase/integrase [Solirubrobacteraceae bacterium]